MELESLEIKIQAQAQQASGQIDALVTRLGRLSSALSGLSTGNLNSLSTGVNRLAGAMTAMRGIDTRTFSAVARNVSKLGSINSKQINAAAGSMRQISNAVKGISGMSASVKGLTDLASAIKQLGYQSSTKAIENIPKLATAMRQLMSELSKAPSVSRNIIDMTNALAKLSRTGGAAGTAAKSITSSFSGFSSSASAVTKKSFSLASAIGKVYATYWTLFRGFRLLGDAIDISSSLTEVENVVRQTFGQYESLINNFAKTSIEKFGMSELSAKQFASRFQAMGTALDIPQGQMAKMSIRLTELAGDMASFYDVSQEDIAKSLQSVFSGTTAPMRRYGIDLTQATLKEWALKQGLDANISSMTQAQKAMLRYQYVLAHTTNITGDFARTADTWHNQITMLKENFKALGAVVGGGLINAFKPFIKVLNAVLQKVISFAEMVTNALGSIFGWRYEASKGAGISGLADDIGSASDGMDDLSDAAGSAGKNTGGIAKNAKKAKKEIQQATRAFDELKVISKQSKDNTSGSGSGGSGGGSGSGGSGGGDTGKLVQTDTIFKKFKSDIKDLEGLGKAISGSLINAMKGIEWDEVYAKASGFGSGLAKFLNGLFEGQKGTTLFGETGKLIANSLNTVLHGLDSFGTTFNWKQFGNSIADGINKFFQNFDFALLAQTLNSWAQGAFDAVTTALSKISWKDVWKGVKEFLSNLDVKTVAIIIGALTIKKILGLHLAKTALGIIGTSISKAIAGSLASRLGVEIAANEGISAVLSTALSKKIGGAFATLGTTVSAGVKALFGSGAAESALSFISPVAKAITGIGSVAIGAFTAISNFVTMLKNGFSWLNEALMLVGVTITAVGAVILGVAAAPAAITAGIVAGVATAAVVVKDHWEEIKGIFSEAGDWFNTNVIKPISGFFKGLWESVSGFFSSLWKDISGVWETVSGWFNTNVINPIVSFFQGFSKRVGQIFEGLWIIVKAVWIVVSDWFKSKVIEPIKKNFELLKSTVSTAFNGLWTTVKSVWAVVSGWFKEHVTTPIKNAFSSAKKSIQKAFSSAKTAVTGAWNGVSSWFKEHVTTPIKNAFSKMKESVAKIFRKLWNSVKSGVAGAMNTVISRIETAINSLIGGVNTVLRGFNSVVSAAAKVAKVKWSGVDLVPKVSLPKVKAYATGGFMDKYSIATVGENGLPEIMGTVGGKPAVAGSQEITGIKDAINSTSAQEVSLLRQQNQLLQAILQKNFGITTNDIGKAARDYGREHYNRTGDNVYVF
nr:MAG TPA: minor tail protein [Caudoviricetes sp.]